VLNSTQFGSNRLQRTGWSARLRSTRAWFLGNRESGGICTRFIAADLLCSGCTAGRRGAGRAPARPCGSRLEI